MYILYCVIHKPHHHSDVDNYDHETMKVKLEK